MLETKVCIVCERPFERPPGMVPARWAQRTCCSRECGSRLPRKGRYADVDADPQEVIERILSWSEVA